MTADWMDHGASVLVLSTNTLILPWRIAQPAAEGALRITCGHVRGLQGHHVARGAHLRMSRLHG